MMCMTHSRIMSPKSLARLSHLSPTSVWYGLTDVIKIYSGGLGVLAGDYLKEASDRNVNLTAVGFLYRYGYFTQSLSMNGDQIAVYEPQDFPSCRWSRLPMPMATQ